MLTYLLCFSSISAFAGTNTGPAISYAIVLSGAQSDTILLLVKWVDKEAVVAVVSYRHGPVDLLHRALAHVNGKSTLIKIAAMQSDGRYFTPTPCSRVW